MTKLKFLLSLNDRLKGLPQNEIEERLNFYSEMIEDRMEEGLSEEEAVSAVGSVDEIAAQIIADESFVKAETEKVKPKKKFNVWATVLIILGFPVWFPLLISAFAIILSLYAVLWSGIISLWSIFGSLVGCAFGIVIAGIGFTWGGFGLIGIAMISAGAVCMGISILFFFLCKFSTKGAAFLTKKGFGGIKNIFVKKREV